MSEQTGPSFGVVLGTVWKVFCAILLIPFLILLAVIAFKVIGLAALVAIAVAGAFWLIRR